MWQNNMNAVKIFLLFESCANSLAFRKQWSVFILGFFVVVEFPPSLEASAGPVCRYLPMWLINSPAVLSRFVLCQLHHTEWADCSDLDIQEWVKNEDWQKCKKVFGNIKHHWTEIQ